MTLDLSQDVLGLPTEFQPAIGDTPKQKKLKGRCAQIQTRKYTDTKSRGVRGKNIAACEALVLWRPKPQPQS